MPLRIAGAFAVLLALASVPIFSTVLPPLVDYPNHLARMHLLAEGGNAFYAVHWAPLPNLAADLIVPALMRVMPLMLAGKVFLALIFALIAGGVVWLNRLVAGAWRVWPLLAFLFLYNRILLWGFINDLFGLGVALCGLALWLALERRATWLRIAVSSLAAICCYFSHLDRDRPVCADDRGGRARPGRRRVPPPPVWSNGGPDRGGGRAIRGPGRSVRPVVEPRSRRRRLVCRVRAQGRSAVQRLRQLQPRVRRHLLCAAGASGWGCWPRPAGCGSRRACWRPWRWCSRPIWCCRAGCSPAAAPTIACRSRCSCC